MDEPIYVTVGTAAWVGEPRKKAKRKKRRKIGFRPPKEVKK